MKTKIVQSLILLTIFINLAIVSSCWLQEPASLRQDAQTGASFAVQTTNERHKIASSRIPFEQVTYWNLQMGSYEHIRLEVVPGTVFYMRAIGAHAATEPLHYLGYAVFEVKQVLTSHVVLDYVYHDAAGAHHRINNVLLYYMGSGRNEYLNIEDATLTSVHNRNPHAELQLISMITP